MTWGHSGSIPILQPPESVRPSLVEIDVFADPARDRTLAGMRLGGEDPVVEVVVVSEGDVGRHGRQAGGERAS